MAKFSFSSPRRFSVWRYDVGHQTLLLRSVRDDSNPTRLDVVIVGVQAMKLPTDLGGLMIREASPDDRESRIHEAGLETSRVGGDALRVFLIGEKPAIGYVIGLNAAAHEDHGAYHDPSYFDLPD